MTHARCCLGRQVVTLASTANIVIKAFAYIHTHCYVTRLL